MNTFFRQQHAPDTTNELSNHYEPKRKILWTMMAPRERPCFNVDLLKNMADFGNTLRAFKGRYIHNGKLESVDYVVQGSLVQGVFNLGGDLDNFRTKIHAGDRDTLNYYAKLCIDVVWNQVTHYGANLTTIALIQGQALGGGFETALSADILIAERGSVMGLPEIRFNLFPGMGALSFLARRVELRQAENIVLSGRLFTAEEMHALGIVDIVAEPGQGEQAVYGWIDTNQRHRNGYLAIQRAKQKIIPISHTELTDIVDIWVDAAMRLDDRDLRMMGKLVEAQNKMLINSIPTEA